MVLPGIGEQAGLKQSQLWTNKLLIGGSGPLQTTGVIGELVISGTQGNLWLSGGISGTHLLASNSISGTNIVATTAFSGAQGLFTGSVSTASNVLFQTGSPYNVGTVRQFTTRTIITGGMWVSFSGNQLAMSAPASTESPLGVALATVGSNSTVNVLTQGVRYMRTEATVNAGSLVRMGAAAIADTVIGAGSPPFGMRGMLVDAATSGTTNFAAVYIF